MSAAGAGTVDMFGRNGSETRHITGIETSSGARTSLYVPELGELYVAKRAGLLANAAILLFHPAP